MTELSSLAKNHSIDLLKGWPSPSLLPVAQIQAASERVCSNPEISTPAFLYGPYAGYEPLREEVAKWLTVFYNPLHAVNPERICITGGASQNIPGILQVYTDPVFTRNIWMISPTYFLASRIFEDSGFAGRLRSVPEDGGGIDVAFLKQALHESEEKARMVGNVKQTLKPIREWSKIYRHIIYAVPSFSNPSSSTMTLERRKQLVQIAREYDALVITDDVYDQLQWPAPNRSIHSQERALLPRIVDVDRYLDGGSDRSGIDGFGNAVSNGSFSKVASPGCRTGWAEGTEKFVYGLSQLGSSWSGGAPSQFTAAIMAELLKSGDIQQHIFQTLRPTYARRHRNMVAAIDTHLRPLGVRMHQSNRDVVGGYFIWLHLPEPLRADDVAVRAAEKDLVIAPGSLFGVSGDALDAELAGKVRVCFAWESEDLFEEGIVRLGWVIRRLQEEMLNDQGAARIRRLAINISMN